MEAWIGHYGSTVLDFGAGRLDQVKILREAGVDCLAFEPYYIGDVRGDVDVDASRALTREFLQRLTDGVELRSIFLASVLNSVPFLEDRRHIVTLLAALCGPKTAVHPTAVSTVSSRFANHKAKAKAKAQDFTALGFELDYERNVILGELTGKPKVQKYHTLPEWRDLFLERFASVDAYMAQDETLVACVARKPLPIPAKDLRAAIEFEFDVPYPDGSRMGLVDEAVAAFQIHTGMSL